MTSIKYESDLLPKATFSSRHALIHINGLKATYLDSYSAKVASKRRERKRMGSFVHFECRTKREKKKEKEKKRKERKIKGKSSETKERKWTAKDRKEAGSQGEE